MDKYFISVIILKQILLPKLNLHLSSYSMYFLIFLSCIKYFSHVLVKAYLIILKSGYFLGNNSCISFLSNDFLILIENIKISVVNTLDKNGNTNFQLAKANRIAFA